MGYHFLRFFKHPKDVSLEKGHLLSKEQTKLIRTRSHKIGQVQNPKMVSHRLELAGQVSPFISYPFLFILYHGGGGVQRVRTVIHIMRNCLDTVARTMILLTVMKKVIKKAVH